MNFLFLTAEQFDLRKKSELGKFNHQKLSGRIKDMSAGGMKVELEKLPSEGIKKSDFMLFHLPYASLRGNLAVSVVNVVKHEKKIDVHLMFEDIDMLTHIKLNQYLHRKKLSILAA